MKKLVIHRRYDLTGDPFELTVVYRDGGSASVLVDPCPEVEAIENLWRRGADPRWVAKLDESVTAE